MKTKMIKTPRFSTSFIFVILCMALLAGSCSKLNNEQNVSPKDDLKSTTRDQPILTATQIDSIGLMHNVLLEEFLDLANMDSILINPQRELDRIIKETEFMSLSEDYRSDLYQYIQDSSYVVDQKVLNYFEKLTSILNNNSSVSSVNDSIFDLCLSVNQDQKLTIEQKQQVFIFCSIAKYSNYFWTSKSQGGSGRGESFLIQMQSERSARSWQNIAGADAFGGLAGGIGWCGAAVFGGPVGVAGFIGGIVWGGASSSLTALALS